MNLFGLGFFLLFFLVYNLAMTPAEIKKALFHLKKDKTLAKAIKVFKRPDLRTTTDHFGALSRSIIYQQISGKAAKAIETRFKALFKGGNPNAKSVKKLSDQKLKSAGLSPQKIKYIRDLSLKFLDGTINPTLFPEMNDEEIREHLISVKGIGRWTADMFLMFTLNRPDVLPMGDLGIQKGFQILFKLKRLPGQRKMEKLSRDWKPYRTIASLYLWQSADNAKNNQQPFW